MLKRLAILSVILVFVSPTLAGGFACDGDADKSMGEMACCAQVQSVNASPVAILCCQIVCGEPVSDMPGPQSEMPVQSPQVTPPLAAVGPSQTFDFLLAVAALNSKRATDILLEHPDPPALYLHNSAFLI